MRHMPKNDDYIDRFKDIIGGLSQTSLFKTVSTKDLEECCVSYLKSVGYTVKSPRKFGREIKDVKDLVTYFYNLLDIKLGGGYMMAYNLKKDMGIAKRFVESRMNLNGYSKKVALNECGEIVKVVIDNLEEFKFNKGLSFHVFGQSNMSWVTDKALKMISSRLDKLNEAREIELQKAMISDLDGSELEDLDDILSYLEDN